MFTKLGKILQRELKPYQDQTDVSFEFALFRDFLFKMKPLHAINPFFLFENSLHLREQNDKLLEFTFLGQKYDTNHRLIFLNQIQGLGDNLYNSACMIAHFFKYLKEENLKEIYQQHIVKYSSKQNFQDFHELVCLMQILASYYNSFNPYFELKFENLAELEYFVRNQEMPRFKCMLPLNKSLLLENKQKNILLSEYFSVQ